MITITLSTEELLRGAAYGAAQFLSSIGRVGRNQQDTAKNGWGDSIVGCIAELAVSNYFGLEYSGCINKFKSRPDVGIFEVRSTPRNDGRLIIRDCDDQDDTIYILVRCYDYPRIYLAGWLEGKNCIKREWLKSYTNERDPAYFVPNHVLKPMEELNYEPAH
jgi:hypothetical protein